ncbi:MAG TPA: TolC family protein [Oscillatoriaceae cyanobacterium]
MKQRLLSCFVTLALLHPGVARAQNAPVVRSLTLEQATALGLAHNRALLAAVQDYHSAADNLRKTQSLLLPTLSLNSGLNGGVPSTNVVTAQAAGESGAVPSSWSVDPNVAMNYDLGIDGGKFAQIDMGRARAEIAKLEIARRQLTLRQSVAGAYYDLQSAEQQVRIAQQDESNAAQSLKDTQILRQAGVSTVFEIQRAQVQLAAAQSALVNAQSQRYIASCTLVQLLGLAPDETLDAVDPVKQAGRWTLSLDQTIARAIAQRPEAGQAKLQEQIAQAEGRLARAAGAPRMQLTAAADQLTFPAWASGYSAGVNLSMPFFDGGAAQAGVSAADADLAAAQIRYDDAVSQLRLQVEQAYAQLTSSRATIATTAAALQEARDSLKSAQLRFEAGVGTQTDLIGAESDLSTADGNAIRAVLNYNRAIATLEALTGKVQG